MAGADVLSGGDGRPRPRWVAVAGIALIVLVTVVLAVRAGSGRPAPPVPAPSARATGGAPGVVAVAVGAGWVYALVSTCGPGAPRACAYQVHRRSVGGGGWTAQPLVTEPRAAAGVVPMLAVSGDDVVTVLEPATSGRLHSIVGGVAAGHPLAPGPPVDAVPADGLVDPGYCATCGDRVTVVEPATGRLRPLRQQPFPDGRLRSYALRGDVLWAVSTTATGARSAVSTDRGRTWRERPIRGLAPDIETLQLVTGPSGPAYLLTGAGDRLVGVWSTQGPGGAWELLPGPIPRGARSALVGERGLLVADPGGTVWLLQPTGAFTSLADPGPTRPELIATGPSRVLAATLRGRIPDRLVLTSNDEGETWRVETIG